MLAEFQGKDMPARVPSVVHRATSKQGMDSAVNLRLKPFYKPQTLGLA